MIMRKTLVLILILLSSTSFYSQNQALIDSLKNELKQEDLGDSLRIVILTKLHEKLMFSHPEEAKQYALQEIEIYETTGLEMGYGLGNLHLGDYYFNRSMNDSALYHYERAQENFLKNEFSRGLVFVNYTIGEIYKSRGQYEKALNIFKASIAEIERNISDEPVKSQFLASSYLSIGSCYLEKGDFNIALRESLKALTIYERIEDEVRKADALKQVGDIESLLKHFESSLEYYTQAEQIYEKYNDNIYKVSATNAIGDVYKEMGDLENARQKQQEAIALSRKFSVRATLAKALNDLGLILIAQGEFLEARNVLLESKDISVAEKLELRTIYADQALASLNYQEKKYQKALQHTDLAIKASLENGAVIALKDLYVLRSSTLEALNQHKEAIAYLKKAQDINDSITSLEKVRQLAELKTIYETEKKETEIALQKEEINTLNEKAKVEKLTKSLYAGGMFSFLAISGGLFFGFRQKIKKNRIARQKQEEIYKKEIEHKKKELASQTLHLVQKNTFLEELEGNLNALRKSPETFKMEFRRIAMLLRKEKASDRDWDTFKTYFSQVHNDFDQKLKTLSNAITEKEIRLAAFLRMNLTTKEIAATMNVLPESVLKSKYRLKKKLGLSKETDLNEFLETL